MAETPPDQSDEPLVVLNYARQSDWEQSLRPVVWLALAMALGRLVASIADSVTTFAATFALPSGSDSSFSVVSVSTGILLAVSQSVAALGCVRILHGRFESITSVSTANFASGAISVGNAFLLALIYVGRNAAIGGGLLHGYYLFQALRVFVINLALAGMYFATWRIFVRQSKLFANS